MSLHTLAQHMAAHGRGPDTMLVHMAPDEVQGLQRLAMARGGSLTINPHTGLVEAGFLSDVWHGVTDTAKSIAKPVVGGINDLLGPAAAPIMGAVGMAFGIPPAVTAAIWGGLSGLATGSLKQGIFAGAGAYGGANLYQGFANAGATATADAATNQAIDAKIKEEIGTKAAEQAALDQSAAESARLGLSQEPFNQAAQQTVANAQAMGPSAASPTAPIVQTATPAAAPAAAPVAPAPAVTPPPTAPVAAAPAPSGIETALTNAGNSASNAYAGLKDITVGGGGLDSLAAAMPAGATTGLKTSATLAAAPAISAGMAEMSKPKDSGAPDVTTAEYTGLIRPWELERTTKKGDTGVQYTGKDKTGERNWFDDYWKQLQAYKAPGPEYKSATGGTVPAYASGGLGDLGGYSDGGRMLKGPGDGMSDSIPAQIGGKQPARLADGEFVVPADVVSHLGNGSTDAGAKQLYKMMDKVRAARTGKKKQAPAVNPGKFMPA